MAENLGASGDAEQAALVRGLLGAELEGHEMNAAFAVVEAEERSGGGPVS